MKSYLLILTIIFSPITIFSQDDLDDIFDDGDKESKFYIGTNINTLASGTLNVYGDFFPIDKFKLTAGVGLMPFNKHRDYTYSVPFKSDEIATVHDNLSGGTFLNIAAALVNTIDFGVDFNYYYYLNFRRNNFSANEDLHNYKLTKIGLGIGYLVGLPGRFNLDIQAGISNGYLKGTYPEPIYQYNYITQQQEIIGYGDEIKTKNSGIGFNLNFGINYAL